MNQQQPPQQLKILPMEAFINQLKLMGVTDEFKNTVHYIVNELTTIQQVNTNIIGMLSLLLESKPDIGKISYTQKEIQEHHERGNPDFRMNISKESVEVWMEENSNVASILRN